MNCKRPVATLVAGIGLDLPEVHQFHESTSTEPSAPLKFCTLAFPYRLATAPQHSASLRREIPKLEVKGLTGLVMGKETNLILEYLPWPVSVDSEWEVGTSLWTY